MSTAAAFSAVILIWGTTPLAIQWATSGSGVWPALTARTAIGVAVCLLLMALLRAPLPRDRHAMRTYFHAGWGIALCMGLVFWSATRIPSSWISVLFGLSPITTGVLATLILGERFGWREMSGSLLGLGGLALVFLQGLTLGGVESAGGVLAVVLATVAYGASGVLVKRNGGGVPVLAQTAGGLLVSLPLIGLFWAVLGEPLPVAVPLRAGLAVLYLGLMGSVVGFLLYYWVLKRIPVGRAALMTLISPVLALLLGAWLNGEPVGPRVLGGTGLILLGLALFRIPDGWITWWRGRRSLAATPSP